jgi:hypothetical protein
MLLIYLSKTYHQGAPVAWLASEKGVDFLIDLFKAEGVLFRVPVPHFCRVAKRGLTKRKIEWLRSRHDLIEYP